MDGTITAALARSAGRRKLARQCILDMDRGVGTLIVLRKEVRVNGP